MIAATWTLVEIVVIPDSIPGPAVFLLLPAAFAWSTRAYRIASGLVVLDVAVGAVTSIGSFGASASFEVLWILLGVLQLTAVAPVRFTREQNATDFWAYAGRLRVVEAPECDARPAIATAKSLLILGCVPILVGLLLLVQHHVVQSPDALRSFSCGSVLTPRSVPHSLRCHRGARAMVDLALIAAGLILSGVGAVRLVRRSGPTEGGESEAH